MSDLTEQIFQVLQHLCRYRAGGICMKHKGAMGCVEPICPFLKEYRKKNKEVT